MFKNSLAVVHSIGKFTISLVCVLCLNTLSQKGLISKNKNKFFFQSRDITLFDIIAKHSRVILLIEIGSSLILLDNFSPFLQVCDFTLFTYFLFLFLCVYYYLTASFSFHTIPPHTHSPTIRHTQSDLSYCDLFRPKSNK